MLGLGLGISIVGVLFGLLAIVVVFIGNESAAVSLLLAPLLAGLPLVAGLAVLAAAYRSPADGWLAVFAACPGWLYAALAVLLSVLGIAVLALWVATTASGQPLPARFHLPVLSLGGYIGTLGLFAGLIASHRQ